MLAAPDDAARLVLFQTNGNLDHAMELLLTGTQDNDDPASYPTAPPLVPTAAPARGAAPASGVHREPDQWSVLVDMGFDRHQAIAALQEAHGDVEAALSLLSEPKSAAPAAVKVPMGDSNYSVSKRPAAARPVDVPDELRIDGSDGNAYDLDSFIDVYGGSRIAPPDEWFSAAPVSATPNTHACMLGTLLASDADALSEQLGTLADMGFPRDAALAALRKSDGNVQAALQELFG